MPTASDDRRRDPVAAIRPPIALRIYVLIFGVVWCGGLTAGLVVAVVHASPAAIVLAPMLALAGTLCYRLFRMCVKLEPDVLFVRNYFRTKRISRADIEGFRVGPMTAQPFGKAIHALVHGDALVPLDVTARHYLFGRGNEIQQRRLKTLNAWLASP